MSKIEIKPKTYLYPMPVVIIGSKIEEKANFMTIAWCGICENNPPMISISTAKSHYTNDGIKKNRTFSVNIPSENMVEITDYIGIISGKTIDKSNIFEIFYGYLKTAPMIKEVPINLECELVKNIDLGTNHDLFIGEIKKAYIKEECLSNGVPDIEKIKPILYSTGTKNYLNIGNIIGKAWKIGKNLKK
ncbi:MAG: flavin reductase family protein [Candidatus Lokiarchaeota archaeon]|nr:flavin reductase family protein [Candidatus Lokiarchaeota archaeon]